MASRENPASEYGVEKYAGKRSRAAADTYGPMQRQHAVGEQQRAHGSVTDSNPAVPYIVQDRYPIHHGAATTVAVITGAVRLAELGYRLQFCDLLSELIEGDPASRNVCETRVKAVAGRPWNIVPADVADGDEQGSREASAIADFCKAAVKRIPKWKSHISGLLWGLFSGVAAREVMWERKAGGEILPKNLRIVPSRRLGYDWDWNLCWSEYGQSNVGTPLTDYPGKFLTFEPSTWDDLPTREGLGRTLVYWLGFKRFGARDLISYVERFGKPYPQIEWRTGRKEDEGADEDEIQTAKDLARNIGRGSVAGVAHPDTLKVSVTGNGSSNAGSGASGENTPHKALIQLCDEQIAKLVLGQAYTTVKGQSTGGLGGGSDVFADSSRLKFVDDARQLEETIDTGLLWWIVALNFGPDKADKYCPHYVIEIDDPEDEDKTATRLANLAKVGMPVPVDFVAERMQIPRCEPGDEILSASGAQSLYRSPEQIEADKAAAEAALAGAHDDEQESDEPKPTKGKKDASKAAPDAAEANEDKAAEKAPNAKPKNAGKSKPKSKVIPKDGGTPKRATTDDSDLDAIASEARTILGIKDTSAR